MTATSVREDITFEVAGQSLAGWFYHPGEGVAAPYACIVMGHGFAGVKEARLDAFAERFAAAGFACLVFDYRHFGASGGEPRQLTNLNRHRADWRAAIACARSRADVDPGRIALWGTSLGGGLVLELIARRHDIRAAVLQSPLVDPWATSAAEAPAHSRRLTIAAIRDIARMVLRRPPYTIPAVGPFDSLAFMTAPEAAPGYFSIVKNAPSWRNEITARTSAQLAIFRPARRAANIRCPVLVITGDADQITPQAVTRRHLAKLRAATHVTYTGGHFDGYLGSQFARCADAAIAFFRRTLLTEAASGGGAPPAA